MQYRLRPQFRLSLLSMALMSLPTLAQPMLEEVVVTAQKRVQNLQDVPISVSAMSGEKVEDEGITNLEELTLFSNCSREIIIEIRVTTTDIVCEAPIRLSNLILRVQSACFL